MKYIIEICVAIDIAILGIAYPILIDKISNIGQKYNSEYLPNVFESEFPDYKVWGKLSFFQTILILTLLSFVFQIFSLQPTKCLEGFYIVDNSADILVFIFTGILTATFIIWLNKIMKYQGKGSDLLNYLINKYNSNKSDDQSNTYLLKTINEFSLYAIKQQDVHLQKSLLDFYYKQFQYYRNKEEDYPFDLYNINYEIIEASLNEQNLKLKALEHRASSGNWLIGESFQFSKILPNTYKWLWRNLVLSSTKPTLLSNYWSTASQYFNYSLKMVTPEYNTKYEIVNQEEINQVNLERKKFLELNYALGGLLYFKKNYDSLKYILTFSQSQPAEYPLLPNTMDEIFYWFDYFSNEFRTIEEPIEYKYPFPELVNLGTSRNISHNICLYIALLFIRQFTRNKIYTYQNFKNFINLTDNLQDLYSYNDRLGYFKSCINTILQDVELLKMLNYSIAPNEIEDTFNELSQRIIEKIDLTKLHTKLSEEKLQQFETSTDQIITQAFDKYESINNTVDFENVDKKMISSINGEMILSSKSSFTDNDIPNLNFDTVYAEHIANNSIKYYVPNSFLMSRTSKFLIERKSVLEALDRIIADTRDIVIVGVRLSYDIKQIIEKSKYKSIVTEIASTDNYLSDTFFILNKNDLPRFESRELTKEEIDKFHLKKINTKYNLYSSVIDINLPENKHLKEEYLTKDEDNELKVLLLISFIFLIKWKQNRKIIMLSLTSPYQERGIPNNLGDLTPLSASR